MINEKLQSYLEELVPPRNDFFEEMEKFAKTHEVPIMERTGIDFLLQLMRIHDAKNILEVGTAIGYSSLRMADALPEAKVVTIERNEQRHEQAKKFVDRSGMSDRIQLVFGDALDTADEVEGSGPFDAIFIDAAKGQYRRFFDIYSRFLKNDGIIITDNVLFKGLVTAEEFKNRRQKALVKKIREFNQWLMENKDYHTVILPVGDGVAISKKCAPKNG